jgi:hypothetical protein
MAEYLLPDELVELQRAFAVADARVQEIVAQLPPASAIVALEAEITDDQREAVEEARKARNDILTALYDHPWWETVAKEDRYAVRLQLRQAASA